MVRAAAACINSEESARPSIDQVISMLQGDDNSTTTDKSSLGGTNWVSRYSQTHNLQKKQDMNSHLALAMLGVADLDEDDFYRGWSSCNGFRVVSLLFAIFILLEL